MSSEKVKLNKLTILSVEDSDEEYEVIKRSFSKCSPAPCLVRFDRGEDLLLYLDKEYYENQKSLPYPVIILLDLNLPGIDGKEVLKKIKSDQQLKKLPVIIFTSSIHDCDIEQCYTDGANLFIQKPSGLSAYYKTAEELNNIWLNRAIHIRT